MNIVAITEQIPTTDRKGNQLVAYYRLTDMMQTAGYAPVVYETPRLRLGISLGF